MENEEIRNTLEKLIIDRRPIRNPGNLPVYMCYLLATSFLVYESISDFVTQTNPTLEDYIPTAIFLTSGTIMHGFKEFLSYKIKRYKQNHKIL